jgi:hypothetical protein
MKRSASRTCYTSFLTTSATALHKNNSQTLNDIILEYLLSIIYIAMFSKAFHRATHNGSIVSWAFHDDSFTEATKDKVFLYQLSHQDIKAIEPHTLVVGGVCDEDRTATKIHRQLVELDILTKSDNHLNATSINGATMAKKIVLITRHKLSLLVNLLFWWEEEMTRWDSLEAKKAIYAQQLEEAHPDESVEERSRKTSEAAKTITWMQREMPGQRQDGKETSWNTTGGSRREWELMELERRMTGRGESSGETDEEEHRLPAYDHGMADGRD